LEGKTEVGKVLPAKLGRFCELLGNVFKANGKVFLMFTETKKQSLTELTRVE